jgi:DNA polymerase III epsilon subunit-like protein
MRIVLGDVETSGLGPDAGVVEVAMLELNLNLEVQGSAHSLINPRVPISPSASGIHGLTDADVANSPTMEEYMGDQLQDGNVILVAHNAPFDIRFFAPHIGTLVGKMCTLKLARLIYPEAPDHKLGTLKFYLGLKSDHTKAHSAMEDVHVLHQLLCRMLDDTKLDLMSLYDLANKPVKVATIPFGKHKGTKLEELPRSYVQWLLGLDNLDENLRYSLGLL